MKPDAPDVGAAQAIGEIFPRYTYLRALIAKSRVLELGAVALTQGYSARFLVQRGAAVVLALDPDAAAVKKAEALATPGLEYRAGDYRSLPKGAFDLILVHDAGPLLAEPDRLELLKGLLSPSGRLVVVARREGALSFAAAPTANDGALAALLEGHFPSIEVSVQTAVVGYASSPQGAPLRVVMVDEVLSRELSPAYRLYSCGNAPTKPATATLMPLSADRVRKLLQPPAPSAPAAADGLFTLGDELNAEEQSRRLRDLENRVQGLLDEVQRADLATAQALAERDHLKNKLKDAEQRLAELSAKAPAAELPEGAEARVAELEAHCLALEHFLTESRAETERLQHAFQERVLERTVAPEVDPREDEMFGSAY